MFSDGTDPRRQADSMERLARRYFYGGFFALPMLWLLNWVYFHQWLKYRHCPPSVKICKFRLFFAMQEANHCLDVRNSVIGFLVYVTIFMGWLTTYLFKREQWGAWGDSISLIIPKVCMAAVNFLMFC
jgi:presenilin enhancer 2